MSEKERFPRVFWRLISRMSQRLASSYKPGHPAAGSVLVLTTTGRKTGLPRPTPLQYDEVKGVFYVTSARGTNADWYRNLVANPEVSVQVGENQFNTRARSIAEAGEIADLLELRIKKHPRFMRAMLNMEGLPRNCCRADLEKFAARLVVVALQPA